MEDNYQKIIEKMDERLEQVNYHLKAQNEKLDYIYANKGSSM